MIDLKPLGVTDKSGTDKLTTVKISDMLGAYEFDIEVTDFDKWFEEVEDDAIKLYPQEPLVKSIRGTSVKINGDIMDVIEAYGGNIVADEVITSKTCICGKRHANHLENSICNRCASTVKCRLTDYEPHVCLHTESLNSSTLH